MQVNTKSYGTFFQYFSFQHSVNYLYLLAGSKQVALDICVTYHGHMYSFLEKSICYDNEY